MSAADLAQMSGAVGEVQTPLWKSTRACKIFDVAYRTSEWEKAKALKEMSRMCWAGDSAVVKIDCYYCTVDASVPPIPVKMFAKVRRYAVDRSCYTTVPFLVGPPVHTYMLVNQLGSLVARWKDPDLDGREYIIATSTTQHPSYNGPAMS